MSTALAKIFWSGCRVRIKLQSWRCLFVEELFVEELFVEEHCWVLENRHLAGWCQALICHMKCCCSNHAASAQSTAIEVRSPLSQPTATTNNSDRPIAECYIALPSQFSNKQHQQ